MADTNKLSFGQQIGLNAATSAVNGIVGGAFGLAGSALNHKYNKEMADYQFDKNLEMWRTQNEYNSPSAQRERLEAAGLNPALMYGGGATSTGNSNSTPSYQMNPIDIMGTLQNAMMTDMQMKQMAANIDKTEAETDLTKSQTEGQNISNTYASPLAEANINNILQQTATGKSQESLNYEQVKGVQVNMSEALSRIKVNDETIAKMRLEGLDIQKSTELKDLQKAMYPLQAALLREQAETERASQYNLTSHGDLAQYQGDSILAKLPLELLNIEAGTSKLLSETNNITLEGIMQSWRNEFYKQYGVFPDASQQQFVLQTLLSGNEEVEKVGKIYRRNVGADTFQKIGVGSAATAGAVSSVVDTIKGNGKKSSVGFKSSNSNYGKGDSKDKDSTGRDSGMKKEARKGIIKLLFSLATKAIK